MTDSCAIGPSPASLGSSALTGSAVKRIYSSVTRGRKGRSLRLTPAWPVGHGLNELCFPAQNLFTALGEGAEKGGCTFLPARRSHEQDVLKAVASQLPRALSLQCVQRIARRLRFCEMEFIEFSARRSATASLRRFQQQRTKSLRCLRRAGCESGRFGEPAPAASPPR